MHTSYFSKHGKHPNAVSIALWPPKWLPEIKRCDELAPSRRILKRWNDTLDNKDNYTAAEYERDYRADVLANLDAKTIYEKLGPDAIMLCFENNEKFCHRHIAAAWLQEQLGITVTELE
jgi:hypothetical protein